MHPVEKYIETHPVLIGLIIAAAPFLFPAVRRLAFRGWRWFGSLFPGNKKVLEEIEKLSKSVEDVKYQVQTNDGGSLKDSVLRTEKRLDQVIQNQIRFESYRQHDFWTKRSACLEMDADAKVSLANQAACRLFRVSDPDELVNHSWLRFLDSHRIGEFKQSFRDTAESGSIFRFSILIKSDDGESRGEWEFNATPIDFEEPKRYSGFFAPVDSIAKSIALRAGWNG
jgi:PAS domain-containing protein